MNTRLPASSGSRYLAATLLVCSLAALAAAEDLALVYAVHRYGARHVIPKQSLLQEAVVDTGSALLPEGQSQCYNLGVGFRKRYVQHPDCQPTATCLKDASAGERYGTIDGPGVGYNNYNLWARSSALDRSISSALSFLAGVFPALPDLPTNDTYVPTGQQVIPVYSYSDAEDLLVRAYTKCPIYQARLQAFFKSAEFKAKEAETADMRNQLHLLWPSLDVSLSNWWNVYDQINIWKLFRTGDPLPIDVDADSFQPLFDQIVELANWFETAKMRNALTGNLLGGYMVADMLEHMQEVVAAVGNGQTVHYRLLAVTGHYNTMLGLLGAMALDQYPPAANVSWLHSLPQFASIIAFELHNLPSAQGMAVRAVIQDGPDAEYVVVPLPCAQAGDVAELSTSPGACTWANFQYWVQHIAIASRADWCRLCGNTDMNDCVIVALNDTIAELQARVQSGAPAPSQQPAAAPCRHNEHSQGWKLGVAIPVTAVGAALLCFTTFYLFFRAHLVGRSKASPMEPHLQGRGAEMSSL